MSILQRLYESGINASVETFWDLHLKDGTELKLVGVSLADVDTLVGYTAPPSP